MTPGGTSLCTRGLIDYGAADQPTLIAALHGHVVVNHDDDPPLVRIDPWIGRST